MKNLNDVKSRLAEVEANRKTEKANIKAELTTTRDALGQLRDERENAPTPEEYKRLTENIKDKEEYISFLESRKNATQEPPLTVDEYKDMKAIIDREFDATVKKTGPEVVDGLRPIVELMDAYLDDFGALTKVYRDALRLKGDPYYNMACLERNAVVVNDDDFMREFVVLCAKYHEIKARKKLDDLRRETIKRGFLKK